MKTEKRRRRIAELEPLILGLRYNGQDPSTASYTCFTVRRIATTLGLSMNQVKAVLARASRATTSLQAQRRLRKEERELDVRHIRFLVHPDNLRTWVPHSLRMRTKLFHRHFPDKVISVWKLSQIYRRHRIVYKKIKYSLLKTKQKQQEVQERLIDVTAQMLKLYQEDKRMIFIDEVTFSSKTRL